MAITWELKIIPISIQDKTASITATRIDSLDPDSPKIYRVEKTPLGTQAEQLAALNEIWDKHQIQLALDIVVDNFLDELETIGKANLEARENG